MATIAVADPSAYVSILNAKEHDGADELRFREFRFKVEQRPATKKGVEARCMGTVTACKTGTTIAPCSASYKAKGRQSTPPAFCDNGCDALYLARLHWQQQRAHEIGAWLAHAHRTSAQ